MNNLEQKIDDKYIIQKYHVFPMILKKVSPTKAWGYGGPHGLFKRGREFDSEDPNDVARLLANIKVLVKDVCES